MSIISENFKSVREKVAAAAVKSGRSEEEVQLLVVSKTWSAEVVQEVVDHGHTLFGENRLQEGEEKIPVLPQELEWHFIGTLQRNKVRKVLPLFPVVQSISSLKLARFTNRVAGELGLRPRVYLEMNLGREESKHGLEERELIEHLDELCALEHLDWQGLMCIPPRAATPEDGRPWFARLREFQEDVRRRSGLVLPEISMGMSGDYEVAIEEGSTMVRVGSAIFGQREPWNP
ncbi:MAG: YggS family pyridoxal phosphate-dependent enzyme [Verrucomicrobiaceae bacterium]